jgi:hypothetical protein
MRSRFFAFGCSYTSWNWATTADFIGIGFDDYYNFGRPGACNTFMSNRLIESDHYFKFNSETDYILIGVTGIGRFSFVNKENNDWATNGDSYPEQLNHPEIVRWIARNLDNAAWAVYRSWIAVKTMKEYLKSKNIKHTIYAAIDPVIFYKNENLEAMRSGVLEKFYDIENMLDIKESIDAFVPKNTKHIYYSETNVIDNHPTQTTHYEYLKKHFPHFSTEHAKRMYDYLETNFDNRSSIHQYSNFQNIFRDQYQKSNTEIYFKL